MRNYTGDLEALSLVSRVLVTAEKSYDWTVIYAAAHTSPRGAYVTQQDGDCISAGTAMF